MEDRLLAAVSNGDSRCCPMVATLTTTIWHRASEDLNSDKEMEQQLVNADIIVASFALPQRRSSSWFGVYQLCGCVHSINGEVGGRASSGAKCAQWPVFLSPSLCLVSYQNSGILNSSIEKSISIVCISDYDETGMLRSGYCRVINQTQVLWLQVSISCGGGVLLEQRAPGGGDWAVCRAPTAYIQGFVILLLYIVLLLLLTMMPSCQADCSDPGTKWRPNPVGNCRLLAALPCCWVRTSANQWLTPLYHV